MTKHARALPTWRPSPDALVRRFEAAMATVPGAQARKMFGYPAAFRNGNMFAGLFQDQMILRLSTDERAELSRHPGAKPFEPMAGRPMREYVVVPPAMLRSPGELHAWLARAFAYAGSLPPKTRPAARPKRQARP